MIGTRTAFLSLFLTLTTLFALLLPTTALPAPRTPSPLSERASGPPPSVTTGGSGRGGGRGRPGRRGYDETDVSELAAACKNDKNCVSDGDVDIDAVIEFYEAEDPHKARKVEKAKKRLEKPDPKGKFCSFELCKEQQECEQMLVGEGVDKGVWSTCVDGN